MIAEPYAEEDGEIAFAIIENPDNPRVYCERLSETRREDEKLYARLDKVVDKICWTSGDCPLPGEPQLDHDDGELFRDLAHFIAEHVEFTDRRYCSLLAAWVLCSWVQERMRYAPRVVFYGSTRSGKSRALKTLRLLSYRGLDLVNPSGAALFRIIEAYHPTVLIDEYHTLNGDRASEVDILFKGGYECGSKIPRARREGGEIDLFNAFGFLAVSTKRLPEEDLQNRSILISMLEKRNPGIRRRMDWETARALRTRLLAFRMKALSDAIDLSPATEEAYRVAEADILVNGETVTLDDRGIDTASNLLVPCCLFNAVDEVLQLVSVSQGRARAELLETFEAQVFFALQAVVKTARTNDLESNPTIDAARISTRDIADQLNQDLKTQGEAETNSNPVPTRRVTRAMQVLGFGIKRGAQNLSYISPADFNAVYQSNLMKFGVRFESDGVIQVNQVSNHDLTEPASTCQSQLSGEDG